MIMVQRLALKRLTKSDLTIFESHFRTRNAGNQKSINLNADVFVSELYPAVPTLALSNGNEMPVSVGIFGPSTRPELPLARKIIKGAAYKNWRLNGEYRRLVNTADTMMQMGRWFGFRRGYNDLVRLFIGRNENGLRDIYEEYKNNYRMEEEFRRDLKKYSEQTRRECVPRRSLRWYRRAGASDPPPRTECTTLSSSRRTLPANGQSPLGRPRSPRPRWCSKASRA
jgi:hypothetical protein